MATPERIDSIRAEVGELVSTSEGTLVEEIQEESKMTRFDVESEAPSASSMSDAASIYFIPKKATTQRQTFSRLLTDELMLRGLDTNGKLGDTAGNAARGYEKGTHDY
jgi:hypothetical protein